MSKNEELNNVTYPVYFENHQFGGYLYDIENFTDITFGEVKTTIINNKPYFSAVDICRGLYINTSNLSSMVIQAYGDLSSFHDETPDTPIVYEDYELYYYLDVEVKNTNRYGADINQIVNTIFISEPMLYMFMDRSRKKEAIRFKVWLYKNVLPTMHLIGKDKSIQLLNTQVNNITEDFIADMNNKYNNLHSIEIENRNMLQQQGMNMHVLKHELDNITSRIDYVGYTATGMAASGYAGIDKKVTDIGNDLRKRVTDIATGLNSVFGAM